MLSEIINQKQQYIKQDTITQVECGIHSLGQSFKFQNIRKLYLSGNKLVKLNGIEQFTQLQYLNLTNNLIEYIQEFALVSQTLQCLFVTGNPFTSHLNYGFVLMNMFANLNQLDNEKINKLIVKEYNTKWQKHGFSLVAYFMNQANDELKGILSCSNTTHLQKLIQICDLELDKKPINQDVQELNSISQTLFKHICKFERTNFSENSIQLFFTNQAMQSNGLDLTKFAEETGYYQEQIAKAFMKYEENLLFPTFPLYKQYTLGLLDFIYQTSLTSKKTVRIQEDRIKPQTQDQHTCCSISANNVSIQNNQIINQKGFVQSKKFDECTQEYLSNYKKLYPFLKGSQFLSKAIKNHFFETFKFQVSLKTKQLQDACIKGVFKLEYCRKIYQNKLKKAALHSIRRCFKIAQIVEIMQMQVNWQKLTFIKHISCLVYVQKKQAILKRDQFLKKLVLKALDPYLKYKKMAKKLKFQLLTYKFNGELRQAFRMIKIKALSFKMEIRKDLEFQLSLPKKNNKESGAMAKFKKLRDLENI